MTFGAFVFAALYGVVCAVIGGLAARAYLGNRNRVKP